MIINKYTYRDTIFKIVGKYENIDSCYIYDGEYNKYYYIVSIDKRYIKTLTLNVIDVETDITKKVTYLLSHNLLLVKPISNSNLNPNKS